MEFTNLLLTVTCAALGVLIGFLAWWGNGVTKKLDALILHREGCISRFADKENKGDDEAAAAEAIQKFLTENV